MIETSINITAKDEHVKETERKINSVKEGARSMQATISMFQKVPQITVIFLIRDMLFWLNCILTKFSNYYPTRIIKDQLINYKVHCKHQFGEFVHIVTKTTNLIELPRTINALAAYLTSNEQRTGRYLNIATVNSISHKKAVNIPTSLDLPVRIHVLVANKSEDCIILDNHGNPFVGSNDLFDAFSFDTESVGVETVNDSNGTSSNSEDSRSDNESKNSGVSDRRPSEEGVNTTDRKENEEQQLHFNMHGMRGNLPPLRASHRSGLC